MKLCRTTGLLALALAATLSAGTAQAQPANKKVYVLTIGGTPQTMMDQGGWGKKFTEETGYEAVLVAKGNPEEVTATVIAQKAHPQFDVVTTDYAPWIRADKQGVFAAIDPAAIPNQADLYDAGRIMRDGKLYGVFPYVYVTGFLYRQDVFQKNGWAPPKSWEDLLDPKYKGKLIIPAPASTYGLYTLVHLARMNGGSEKNIDPGFKALAKLAPDIADFSSNSAKIAQLMQTGTADIAVYSVSQARSFQAAGVPTGFTIPSPAYINPSVVSIVKGGPNPKGAEAFANWSMSKAVLTYRAEQYGQTPMSKAVVLKDGPGAAVIMTPDEIAHLATMDYDLVSEKQPEWQQRFQAEIASIPRAD